MPKLRLMVLSLLILLVIPLAAQDETPTTITLEPYIDQQFVIDGLRPEGWTESTPGVFARARDQGDITVLLQQSLPFPPESTLELLLPQLGLETIPESAGTYESESFTWTLYSLEVDSPLVGTLFVELGLTQRNNLTYIVLLQGNAAESEALRQNVFLPIIDALRPLAESEQALPPYVDLESITEEAVEFGLPDWRLPGTLTLPDGLAPFPAVVLVQGSGANDRNASLGPNLMFRDLAWGLATQGIAVLRYDERLFVYGQEVGADGDFTIDEEITEDALAAVEYLRGREEISNGDIFIAGHSLGGTVAPRIGSRAPQIAGLILLAASARPFEDVLFDQIAYQLAIGGGEQALNESAAATFNNLRQTAEGIAAIREGTSPETAFPDNPLDATYWNSLVQYDQTETAQSLEMPMLILQGERDYQVTTDDFILWRESLVGKENVTFISYPDLMHLFMPLGNVERLAYPADSLQQGFVAENVINDISTWIYARRTD